MANRFPKFASAPEFGTNLPNVRLWSQGLGLMIKEKGGDWGHEPNTHGDVETV